jgi:hypothetical protein
MHGTFTARRQARQYQSQRGVAVFPPTIVISITPLDRRGLQCILRRPAAGIRSRQPLLDAARELLRLGADPDAILIMRRFGSSTESLRARIGVWALLTVKERDRRGPVLEAWGRHPFSPVSAPVARTKPPATTAHERAERAGVEAVR